MEKTGDQILINQFTYSIEKKRCLPNTLSTMKHLITLSLPYLLTTLVQGLDTGYNSDDITIALDSNLRSSKRVHEATSATTFFCILSNRLFTDKCIHWGRGAPKDGAIRKIEVRFNNLQKIAIEKQFLKSHAEYSYNSLIKRQPNLQMG